MDGLSVDHEVSGQGCPKTTKTICSYRQSLTFDFRLHTFDFPVWYNVLVATQTIVGATAMESAAQPPGQG